MNSTQYAATVLTTESKIEKIGIAPDLLLHTLLLAARAGHLIDLVKKAAFYQTAVEAREVTFGAFKVAQSADALTQALSMQDQAEVTRAHGFDIGHLNKRLLHCALGKFGESAELIAALVKTLDGTPLDKINFLEELGDVDWYGPLAHDELGISEEGVRAMNVAKLTMVRYASKKFTGPEAKTRRKALERDVMTFIAHLFMNNPGISTDEALSATAVTFDLEYTSTTPLSEAMTRDTTLVVGLKSDGTMEPIPSIDGQRSYNPKG